MNDDLSSKINVYMVSHLVESLLFKIENDHWKWPTWKSIELPLPTCSNQFQLVIEGVRGKSPRPFNSIMIVKAQHIYEYCKPQENWITALLPLTIFDFIHVLINWLLLKTSASMTHVPSIRTNSVAQVTTACLDRLSVI